MHRSVEICFYILEMRSFKRKYLHHSAGQTDTVSVLRLEMFTCWCKKYNLAHLLKWNFLIRIHDRVVRVGMSQQNETVSLRGGSVPGILSGGTSSVVVQLFARLNCSALTSRRFSRGSWRRSSASSRWNRPWPWCGRWPCPPPSRGCPPPLGGSLGWPSSAAPPLRMGSAGRKPKAARWRSVTLSFHPKDTFYLFPHKSTELQHFTSSPASFFTTCWADNTLVAAIADARLCKNEENQRNTCSMVNSNSVPLHFWHCIKVSACLGWSNYLCTTSVGRSERMRTVHLLDAIWKVKLMTPLTFRRASSQRLRWSCVGEEHRRLTCRPSAITGRQKVSANAPPSTHSAVQALDVKRDRLGLLAGGVDEKLRFLPPLRLGGARRGIGRCSQDVVNLLCQGCDVKRKILPTWRAWTETFKSALKKPELRKKKSMLICYGFHGSGKRILTSQSDSPGSPSCPVRSSWSGRWGTTRPSSATSEDRRASVSQSNNLFVWGFKMHKVEMNLGIPILHNNKNTNGTRDVLCFVFFWKSFQPPPLTWSVANSTSWLWWSRKRTSPGRQPSSWTMTARFWGSEARSRSWVTTDSASITWSWTRKTQTGRACLLLLLLCGFDSVFHLWTTDSNASIMVLTKQTNKRSSCVVQPQAWHRFGHNPSPKCQHNQLVVL